MLLALLQRERPADYEALLPHADWIKAEVLAVSIDANGATGPTIAKVEH